MLADQCCPPSVARAVGSHVRTERRERANAGEQAGGRPNSALEPGWGQGKLVERTRDNNRPASGSRVGRFCGTGGRNATRTRVPPHGRQRLTDGRIQRVHPGAPPAVPRQNPAALAAQAGRASTLTSPWATPTGRYCCSPGIRLTAPHLAMRATVSEGAQRSLARRDSLGYGPGGRVASLLRQQATAVRWTATVTDDSRCPGVVRASIALRL